MTPQQIKENTRLVCIDDSKQKVLKEGKIYTVHEIDRNRVYVKEWMRFSFLLSRFEVHE